MMSPRVSLLCLSGESATHYLVKNTVKTFKELGVRQLQCLECAYVPHVAFNLFFKTFLKAV